MPEQDEPKPEQDEPKPEQDEPKPERTIANWILAGLITAFGLMVFTVAVRDGHADSALLFVALPVILAAALALTPGRTSHGRVFGVTTIALLLAAVALHEGAICVLLAAPLVYAVAHGSTALIRAVRRSSRTYAVIAVPLLLLPGLEGSGIGPRIDPVQSVEVTRVVGLPPEEVAARIAAGPRPAAIRSASLRLLGVPTPGHVVGDGVEPGDRWAFGYHGSAHGPGGHLLAEVEVNEPGHLGFRFVEDTSITGRWLTWRHADLRWQPAGSDRTQIRVTVRYERGLDPSWYFGPLQNALLGEGVEHLLDMMTLR
ncbi:SRPBCC family protein [Micromonospora musae]|uniref:SRPBCC family protein n=1 Tax=Micromonospora musae TaxID=1894970 RepID=A0A3A9Y2P9_9ACTN|nr:SRPBCC family protein [Micromonospora musae]RKN31668.1 SRPBCC family protein [Micromonospora musae]